MIIGAGQGRPGRGSQNSRHHLKLEAQTQDDETRSRLEHRRGPLEQQRLLASLPNDVSLRNVQRYESHLSRQFHKATPRTPTPSGGAPSTVLLNSTPVPIRQTASERDCKPLRLHTDLLEGIRHTRQQAVSPGVAQEEDEVGPVRIEPAEGEGIALAPALAAPTPHHLQGGHPRWLHAVPRIFSCQGSTASHTPLPQVKSRQPGRSPGRLFAQEPGQFQENGHAAGVVVGARGARDAIVVGTNEDRRRPTPDDPRPSST